jgi:hypothetical protein
MAAAYSSEAWSELFVASAGASAALTGLLFVAVSVNIERILEFPGLPERALQMVPGAREHERAALHLTYVLPGTLMPVIGGASLLAGAGGGLYWIVAGILGAILGSSVNAWVLMVEILR